MQLLGFSRLGAHHAAAAPLCMTGRAEAWATCPLWVYDSNGGPFQVGDRLLAAEIQSLEVSDVGKAPDAARRKAPRLDSTAFDSNRLLRSYFCVTTNLTRGEPSVHTRGQLWKLVRASMTIVGLVRRFDICTMFVMCLRKYDHLKCIYLESFVLLNL